MKWSQIVLAAVVFLITSCNDSYDVLIDSKDSGKAYRDICEEISKEECEELKKLMVFAKKLKDNDYDYYNVVLFGVGYENLTYNDLMIIVHRNLENRSKKSEEPQANENLIP